MNRGGGVNKIDIAVGGCLGRVGQIVRLVAA